ncbi:hypothetical protein HZA42_04605 [Candidatus Peregrinibacteria bacterium]|nr:hypothetical protein [Candidatus Peregrinibacteria bacterium]
MKLVITASLKETEYEPLRKKVTLEILKKAARKSLEGLGDNIKNSKKITGTLLNKIYLTTPGGAARVVFLIQISENQSVLVMIRLKNDKKVGSNMTVDNPRFRAILEKNLDSILRDLNLGMYEVYEV